ncbi:carbon starvation CstA family protein [Adhaeretor mobilis]|uniref:Carbon starvation protein A n=1 Tax=Adhaeretor mobilis TaxID=1930276 RepID=A0A517MSK5_9BACT|nr:carbon starvation protein A [Adhaeretor mobilis]QDS97862.1 Carbon starvation protein A [Adhaeretor mobilis]
MFTLLVAFGSFAGFLLAYHTYGRWLARKLFALDQDAEAPSVQLCDNIDYVPTPKHVVFGHHFTSIAGTGPIVGPAIAVFWGWLPALLWVLIGSIFIGAVHDFGALVISLRNRGQTVGEIAGRIISPRAKVLFLTVLFLALTIVLAIFGLVIAKIFEIYPQSVLSVWIAMPLAVAIGFWYRRGGSLLWPSVIALVVLYAAVYIGAEHLPLTLPAEWSKQLASATGLDASWFNPVVLWTTLLMIYCFIASVLPVWVLLQPRDYINSHQLFVALVLLIAGLGVAALTGQADLQASTPAIAKEIPADAPPIFPFLFVTIACGAVSGFHCLVSSGTTSKQIAREPDAQYVAVGGMLLEGALAVLVILACCAGLGMGVEGAEGRLTGRAAWESKYQSKITEVTAADGTTSTVGGWANHRLGQKVGAFVDGGANFLSAIGIPLKYSLAVIAVLVACFAATTLDTATRLQRYVIQELGASLHVQPLTNKYTATFVAVAAGLAVAMIKGPIGPGSGGMILWPLFGATNQLLAGLAMLVTAFYLWRRGKPVAFIVVPMALMFVMPAWAMLWNMFNAESGWWQDGNYLLVGFGAAILALQAWMIAEAWAAWPRAKNILEEALPPLPSKAEHKLAGGRSC